MASGTRNADIGLGDRPCVACNRNARRPLGRIDASNTSRSAVKSDMAEIARLAEESGLTLRLARVKPAVAATLDRDGVLERIGPDHIHGSVHRAVQAQEAMTADNTGLEPT